MFENIPIWIWAIILVQTVLLIVLVLLQIKCSNKNDSLEEEINRLSQANEDEKERSEDIRKIINDFYALRIGVDEALRKEDTLLALNDVLEQIEDKEVWLDKDVDFKGKMKNIRKTIQILQRRSEIMNLLQTKVVAPFYKDLVNSQMNEYNSKRLRGEVVATSFKLLDGIQSAYEAMPDANDVQLDVLREKSTMPEAIAKAHPVTTLIAETEQWAIKLNPIIQNMNLPAGTYLLKAYKFEIIK